jgi:hypothetical protein
MQDERHEFVTRFLPVLRGMCEPKGVFLKTCDLRWGITDEQQSGNQTLHICLKEIDMSDIFVGFFGERYGSRFEEPDMGTKERGEGLSWWTFSSPAFFLFLFFFSLFFLPSFILACVCVPKAYSGRPEHAMGEGQP